MIKIIKIGGEKLKNPEDRRAIYTKIKKILTKNKVVLVCSAFGRGDNPYSTDYLVSVSSDLEDKERASLLSLGEVYSTHVIAGEMRRIGLKCKLILPNEVKIVTDSDFINGKLLKNYNSNKLVDLKYNDLVVFPGFQAKNLDGYTTLLGRGGSDLTAMILANSLGLNEVELIKDVNGVYSCDPKKMEGGVLLKRLNYDQMMKIIDLGSRVIQKEALLYAKENNITIKIKGDIISRKYTKISNNQLKNEFYCVLYDENTIKITCNNIDKIKSKIINFLNIIKDKKIDFDKNGIYITVPKVLISTVAKQLHDFLNNNLEEINNEILENS